MNVLPSIILFLCLLMAAIILICAIALNFPEENKDDDTYEE